MIGLLSKFIMILYLTFYKWKQMQFMCITWSLLTSVNAGKCKKACQGCTPRSSKKTRDALFGPSQDWQEGPTPFSRWYNCHCFVPKPWPYIQRSCAKSSSLSPKSSGILIIHETKTKYISTGSDFGLCHENQTSTLRSILLDARLESSFDKAVPLLGTDKQSILFEEAKNL